MSVRWSKVCVCLHFFHEYFFFRGTYVYIWLCFVDTYSHRLHFTQVILNTEDLKHTTHIYSILGQWQDSRSARDLLQAPRSCCRTRQSEWQTCASDRPSVGKRASTYPEQCSSDHQFSSYSTQRSDIPEIEEIICNGYFHNLSSSSPCGLFSLILWWGLPQTGSMHSIVYTMSDCHLTTYP